MASYSFKDYKRTECLYASDAIIEDRNKTFYCPNPYCDAHMHICAMDGSKRAYFRATEEQFQHIDNCPYSSKAIGFNSNEYDEEMFQFDNAINNLLNTAREQRRPVNQGEHPEGEVRRHPPRTLNQIYAMCKSYEVHHRYGDKEIGEMLLDNRSLFKYSKGCFGIRIIEAQADNFFYSKEKLQIYLTAPLKSEYNSNYYSFILQFQNKDVFKKIKNEIYNNRNNIIVIAGEWKKSEKYNCFISNVNNSRQVYIVKK